jgi:Domain of unknown function (DUF4157)
MRSHDNRFSNVDDAPAIGSTPGRRTLTQTLTSRQPRSSDQSYAPIAGSAPSAVQRAAVTLSQDEQQIAQLTGLGVEATVHGAAAHGISGPGSSLPYLDTIQRAFGRHDVSSVLAHVGAEATAGAGAMGALAYATGDHVAFAHAPDLHTAAHEAAHVIQQRGGVQLRGGVGQEGDPYEQHADAVADKVVRGESAAALLETAPRGGAAARGAVQRTINASHRFAGRGDLTIDMKPDLADDGRYGEGGAICFAPSRGHKEGEYEVAGEVTLVQTARTTFPSGQDFTWWGKQQPREMMKTPGGDVDGDRGWVLDHDVGLVHQRQAPTDAPVRRDYNATIPGAGGEERKGMSARGMGAEVFLRDHPSSTVPMRFQLETAVIASRPDHRDMRWGAVQWGFETALQPGAERKLKRELADWTIRDTSCAFVDAPSRAFEEAVALFDSYYRNPEAETAPERLEQALLDRLRARQTAGPTSRDYLEAEQRVQAYAAALWRFVEVPAPAYGREEDRQAFEALQQVFKDLVYLAVMRDLAPDLGEQENLHAPAPQPQETVASAMEIEEDEEQRLQRTLEERRARRRAILAKYPKQENQGNT